MKRINITEQQFQNVSQQLSQMRSDTSDLKLSDLKCYARDAIGRAFRLGKRYRGLSMLDIKGRKNILQKLNEIISRIDDVV